MWVNVGVWVCVCISVHLGVRGKESHPCVEILTQKNVYWLVLSIAWQGVGSVLACWRVGVFVQVGVGQPAYLNMIAAKGLDPPRFENLLSSMYRESYMCTRVRVSRSAWVRGTGGREEERGKTVYVWFSTNKLPRPHSHMATRPHGHTRTLSSVPGL